MITDKSDPTLKRWSTGRFDSWRRHLELKIQMDEENPVAAAAATVRTSNASSLAWNTLSNPIAIFFKNESPIRTGKCVLLPKHERNQMDDDGNFVLLPKYVRNQMDNPFKTAAASIRISSASSLARKILSNTSFSTRKIILLFKLFYYFGVHIK